MCKFAQATYRRNWPDDPASLLVGDIRRIVPAQIPAHDLLVAGFPCQDFSNAGSLDGFTGRTGSLFFELVRIISGCQPRAILLENVRGLVTNQGVIAEIVRQLRLLGYYLHARLLDAATLLPQRRYRVFIVGFRVHEAAAAFYWPRLPALRRCASDILQPEVNVRTAVSQ